MEDIYMKIFGDDLDGEEDCETFYESGNNQKLKLLENECVLKYRKVYSMDSIHYLPETHYGFQCPNGTFEKLKFECPNISRKCELEEIKKARQRQDEALERHYSRRIIVLFHKCQNI